MTLTVGTGTELVPVVVCFGVCSGLEFLRQIGFQGGGRIGRSVHADEPRLTGVVLCALRLWVSVLSSRHRSLREPPLSGEPTDHPFTTMVSRIRSVACERDTIARLGAHVSVVCTYGTVRDRVSEIGVWASPA